MTDSIRRKVQLTGGSTYTVSLPKDWADAQGLNTGSYVHLHPRDESLLLTKPAAMNNRRSLTISAEHYEPIIISRVVAAAYTSGTDKVRIEDSPGRRCRTAVREVIRGLIGIEVAKETNEVIVVRTMIDDNPDLQQILTQIKKTCLTMHEEAMVAVASASDDAGRNVQQQDDIVDRLFRLIAREFHRSITSFYVDRGRYNLTMFEYYTIARQLERIADHAEKIARTAEQIESPPNENLTDSLIHLGSKGRGVVRRGVSETVSNPDTQTLVEIISDAKDLLKQANQLDRKLNDCILTDGYAIATVLDSVVRTIEYGINIAEVGSRASLHIHEDKPNK